MKKRAVVILIVMVVVVLSLGLYLSYSKKCTSRECFDSSFSKCKKAGFINDAGDAAWKYSIKPDFSCYLGMCSECLVNVELLEIKQGDVEMEDLQGLEMDCRLPVGYVGDPQDNLERCHGLLKEQLQYKIIEKMHSYIIVNIGEVSQELSKVV